MTNDNHKKGFQDATLTLSDERTKDFDSGISMNLPVLRDRDGRYIFCDVVHVASRGSQSNICAE